VITQLRPISVTFNLPQQDLPQVNAAFAKGALAVDALRSDNDAVLDHGTLKVVDNQVDQTTGTVKLKAEFPNPDLQLWPGQFVNIRLLIDTLKQVVVVPTSAVQRGPSGTFVYVIKDDNTVTVRPIVVQKQDEVQTVIKSGLDSNERVVTTGFVRLTDGSRISIGTAETMPTQDTRPRTGTRPDGKGERKQQRGSGSPKSNPQQ
jgi:multidrug efflux system membrane fusion protein